MKHTTQLTFCIAVITFIIILLTGCEKQITRKADWETNFNDIHFVDAKHGWIVGEKGMIIHTNDSGKTWEQQETGTEGDFKSVYFTNLLNGWAVGDNGLIATTDDGGKHWYLQESGIYSMLNGIFFANSKEGWVVGEDADILHTQDGGKTWKRQSVSEFPFPFNGVWFMNNRHGWAVGSYDRIFYTEDGGKTWRDGTSNLLKGNDWGRLYDNKNVFFISPNEGWIVGSDGSIFHTTNGGMEWIPQDSRIPLINGADKFDIYSIHFANNKRGALVAQFGFINYTEDGGKNWRLVESGIDNHLTAVQFTSPTEVWAVGWYGTILHSKDGGATWQMVSGTTANDLQEVQFTDANRAIAVGKHGTIAMSQDGGQTWTDVQTDIWDDIRGVYFASDKEGWAVGERGLIVHTTDGGQSWKPQTSGSGFPLNSAHFVTPKKGWVVGELGTVLHTDDGGQSWVPQTQEEWQMFKGVFFLDEKEGWMVGWPGLVMHTTNGGLTWTKQDTKTYNELYAVHFIDNQVGWVVGQFGEILHTNDGGVTWKFQHSGTQANLNKVYFADANMGIITGDNGVILMTANGGQKWHLQDSGTDNDLYGFALSPTGLVAVGKNGIATRYSIDTEKIPVELPPVQLPPVAEETKEPQVIVEQPTVDEVSYQWEIIRQATWRTDFADVYFLDEQTGWAVGSGGVIAHTTDGGKTWRPQHSGVKDDLRIVIFVNATHGWIAGSGVLLRTENGGETWQVIRDVLNASTIDYDLESPTFHLAKSQLTVQTMQFLNPKEGWLGVDEGQICHVVYESKPVLTTDGGLTWKIHQTSTTYAPITYLHFINSKEGLPLSEAKGWAVAPDRFGSDRPGGLILHTVDGGDYWQIQYKSNQLGVAVYFTDTKSGWVVMEDGNSLVTDDGGVTWIMKPSNLVNDTQLKISPHYGRILSLTLLDSEVMFAMMGPLGGIAGSMFLFNQSQNLLGGNLAFGQNDFQDFSNILNGQQWSFLLPVEIQLQQKEHR